MESIVIAARSDSSHFTHPYVHVTSKAVDNWFKVKTGMTTTQCAAALESFATADLSGELSLISGIYTRLIDLQIFFLMRIRRPRTSERRSQRSRSRGYVSGN